MLATLATAFLALAVFALFYEFVLTKFLAARHEWAARQGRPVISDEDRRKAHVNFAAGQQQRLQAASQTKRNEEDEVRRLRAVEEIEDQKRVSLRTGQILRPSEHKKYSPLTGSVLTERPSAQISQRDLLISQQDMLYTASLDADQQKEQRRQARLDTEKKAQKERDEKMMERHARRAEREARMGEIKKRFEHEPPVNDPYRCHIALRLPNGGRKSRWLTSYTTLETLFEFAEMTLDLSEDLPFDIIAPFPKRTWSSDTPGRYGKTTLAEQGIKDGDALYVELRDPPDDD